MGMMYIPHLKTRSLSGKTARTESRQSSLVSQFAQRIVLVHELRELRAAEKFFDSRRDWPDIHQSLRSCRFHILNRHSLLDDSFHPGKADTELILQEFSYGSQAAVAQVVDIIHSADIVIEIEDIAHRSDNIFN